MYMCMKNKHVLSAKMRATGEQKNILIYYRFTILTHNWWSGKIRVSFQAFIVIQWYNDIMFTAYFFPINSLIPGKKRF